MKSWAITRAVKCIQYKRLNTKDFMYATYNKVNYLAAYGVTFHPMLGLKSWDKIGLLEPTPPALRKMPGRPSKKKRRLEPREQQESRFVKRQHMPNKCTRCGELRHNKRSYKNTTLPPSNPDDPKNKGGKPKGSSSRPTKRAKKGNKITADTEVIDSLTTSLISPSSSQSSTQQATQQQDTQQQATSP